MIRNVVIVGAGIGAQHLEGFASLPDLFRVTAVCDLNTERAEGIVKDYPGVAVVSDLNAVLADPEVHIVDICLPPHLHFKTAMAVLEAGKTVICEKPLVSSLAEADCLADKAKETGCGVYPVFQYRYGLGTAQLHALMEAGLAGKCFGGSLETHWNRQADYYAIDWRGTWAGEQGGALLGHAIHIHDLLSSLLGPVARLHAELATRVNDIEVEDCAALSIRMESGAVVTSSVTLGCAEDTSRLRLMFEGFTVESDHAPYAPAANSWSFKARAPYEQTAIDKVLSTVVSAKSGYAGMFEALHEAMNGANGREVTLADGRRSLEFVTGCYHSSREGVAVNFPLDETHPLYSGWLPN